MASGRSQSRRSDHRSRDRSRPPNSPRSRSGESAHRRSGESEPSRRDASPVVRKELFPNRRPSSKDKFEPQRRVVEPTQARILPRKRNETAEKSQREAVAEPASRKWIDSSHTLPTERPSHPPRRASSSPSSDKHRNRDRIRISSRAVPTTGENSSRGPTSIDHTENRARREGSASRKQSKDRLSARALEGKEDSKAERDRVGLSKATTASTRNPRAKAEGRVVKSDRESQRTGRNPATFRERGRSESPAGPAAASSRLRDRSPLPRWPRSPPSPIRSGRPTDYHHSRDWSPDRPYWSPRRDLGFEYPPQSYRGRSPYHRGVSPRHDNWDIPPQSYARRHDYSPSPAREARRRTPPRYSLARRSRSRSVHSRESRRPRSRGGSPEMYNNSHSSRGRYPPASRGYSNSPPHPQYGRGHPEEYRGSWQSYGPAGSPPQGYGSHGPHSPHPAYTSRSPFNHGPSHGPPSGPSNSTFRGRGGGVAPSPASRGHFQNLSWTPDKGSRGGVAPTERLTGAQKESSNDIQSGFKDGNNPDPKSLSDSDTKVVSTISPPQEARPQFEKSDEKPKEARAPPTGPSAASKPGIKFEMKIQSQPVLAKKPNVIQSAIKIAPKLPPTPPRPSPFSDPRRSESLRLVTQPPSGPRRDDWRNGPARDSRGVPLRSPIATKGGPESWDRNKHEVPIHKAAKPTRRRQKKMIQISRTHRRVVLPIRKLPVNWAQSEFVYYPKPDGQSVVGAGTYGKVFKAHNVYLSKVVALKTLPLTKLRRKAGPRDIYTNKKRKRNDRWIRDGLHLTSLREIKLLKSISHLHNNIVGIREIFLEADSCNLVFDYFEFDMHGIIYSSQIALEDSMLKDLCRQLFCGLDFLHTRANILHRDIKAANILVSTAGQVRITDFGLAKHVKTQAELDAEPWYKKKFENSNRVITTPYRPPELFLGATLYGGEVDVWSAGCVLFEAFLRKLPFQGNSEDVDHLLTLWKILGLPNIKAYPEILDLEWYWLISPRVIPKMSIFAKLYKNEVTPQLYHLLRCIFQHDPKRRPTAGQALLHPFFTTEEPLPKSAQSVLETVEGEWHELEYKMMRDKERAEVRRKHEDNVVVCFLRVKQEDHERKLANAVDDTEAENAILRIDFYKNELATYQSKMKSREQEIEEEQDHVKQVAELKKTHGSMYMDTARRGRYRGPDRDKGDEKVIQEAWKWYEEEKKKGNDPLPSLSLAVTKPANEASRGTGSVVGDQGYQSKYAAYERHLSAYNERKAKHRERDEYEIRTEKRAAMSPLVDERERKKAKEDEEE